MLAELMRIAFVTFDKAATMEINNSANRQSVISMKGLDNICKFADDVRKKYVEKYIAAMYGDSVNLGV